MGKDNVFSKLDKIVLGSVLVSEYSAIASLFSDNEYLAPISYVCAGIGSLGLLYCAGRTLYKQEKQEGKVQRLNGAYRGQLTA